MKAILRLGYCRHYSSPVFGVYRDPASPKDPFDAYVVCLDDRRETLTTHPLHDIAQYPFPYPRLLFTDMSGDGWVEEEGVYAGVPFIPLALARRIAMGEEAPADVVERCRALDDGEAVDALRPVTTDAELQNLLTVAGYLHDARADHVTVGDDTVTIEFWDVWGCTLELVFSGDTAYCLAGDPPETYWGRWMCGSLLLQDGYFYLADTLKFSAEELNDEYCWIRGKTLQFRLTPG